MLLTISRDHQSYNPQILQSSIPSDFRFIIDDWRLKFKIHQPVPWNHASYYLSHEVCFFYFKGFNGIINPLGFSIYYWRLTIKPHSFNPTFLQPVPWNHASYYFTGSSIHNFPPSCCPSDRWLLISDYCFPTSALCAMPTDFRLLQSSLFFFKNPLTSRFTFLKARL